MYVYDDYDRQILTDRVKQYRGQTDRYLKGELSENEFLPLRLQNGLYIQRLAPMLRVCVPYGMLNTKQIRKLAELSRKYDKGYVHFSTRQNVQFNWPALEHVPEMLKELAEVEMHAIQTSGNCIRNTTTDQFAGVSPDEHEDPRAYCEIIRQWSTFHPEFAFLPRKFKMAVCGSTDDRAAIRVHDIAIEIVKDANGEVGFRMLVGGGLGRTPVVAPVIKDFLPKQHLLSYLEAVLRVYNQMGRRDNKYKARIKILVRAMGVEAFSEAVEAEWAHLKDGPATLHEEEFQRMKSFFTAPQYKQLDNEESLSAVQAQRAEDIAFDKWVSRSVRTHKVAGYSSVTLSTKPTGVAPGDVTDKQLEQLADLADEFSFSEMRTTHSQNCVLADVETTELYALWKKAKAIGLATPNVGFLTDMICCPGGDYCALANAKSIPVAEAIQRRFDNIDYLHDLGPIDLNISGCMNACGHHHVGHIGILGVDKKGEEFYQVMLGGNSGLNTSLAKVLGPSFKAEEVSDVIAKILTTFTQLRNDEELFIDTYRRVGIKPFKESVYA
ncbi:sulfite reductase (NADPH) hemoprotein beta-component [Sinobacterium caligoides]|uniref:Sulfite reductase (NADPH) hemoprotein beta-component n=1 Tax=Sinobacterium caligoides TaxID=933926 RepID=A0A3N2DJN7_9GAMM|nr:nitrite/sulfite reductase [Sinobacterium caligoides]ROS00010.1 sulfite reductase (NADPH) hemoprotein beta-component [Sinobacterium caligoides]